MDNWHSQLYECLGVLFGGDPSISATQQNESNTKLIELIAQVQSDVMIDVYVDVLSKAHDMNFRSMASSTHALFWAASGLRGLVQLPRAWFEYGSQRQGATLNTLLKLLGLSAELDPIILRQVADSVSCVAVLMVGDWTSLFEDLFSACQVSSVDTLSEPGGKVRVEILLNILGGIPEYTSRVSHLIAIEHYNKVIHTFHQRAFETYIHPFISGIVLSILSGSVHMQMSGENEKVVCVALECLQSWAACDVGNPTVQIVEGATSWAPLLIVARPNPNQADSPSLLNLIIDGLLVNPKGTNSFLKVADVVEQLLLFPCSNICEILNIAPILNIFHQLLQASNNGDTSNELFLRYLSRVFFTLFDRHSEVVFYLEETFEDVSIYSNAASSSSNSTANQPQLTAMQVSLLEALMLCTRHKQDLEYLAVPSLECWCNIIFSSPHLFDVNLIHQLVNSILATCMLPSDQSEESWLLLRYGGQTASDDYLDGLQCYRADAADTLLALFDMKEKVNTGRNNQLCEVSVGNVVLEALTSCSTSAFNSNSVNEIEVVVWASSQFVEAAIDYIGDVLEEEGYNGHYEEDEEDTGNYYGPPSTPTKASAAAVATFQSPSSGVGFTKASNSPAYKHPNSHTPNNHDLSPQQQSISEWKDWLLQLVQALSSLPLMSSPLLACITSDLYKELAPLIEIVRNGELLLCMITNMVNCMSLAMASKPAAQCIYRLINQCSQVFKHGPPSNIETTPNSSSYHTSLVQLLEQLHSHVVPTCLAHASSTSSNSTDFNIVLRTCVSLTCTTYLDTLHESKNLDVAAAEICRFISPRLQHALECLTDMKTRQQPISYSASYSIQQIDYALGALGSRNNFQHNYASVEKAQLSSTLLSLLWNDFTTTLNMCEEITTMVGVKESAQSVEVISLIEDSIYGCLSCLFKLIILETDCSSSVLFEHVNSLVSVSLRKPFRGGRYLPPSLVTLTGLLYDVYNHNPNSGGGGAEYSLMLHDMLVVMVERISGFNQLYEDFRANGTGFTHWNVKLGCDSLVSAGVEAAVTLCGVLREVMKSSPALLCLTPPPPPTQTPTAAAPSIEASAIKTGNEHRRGFIQSLWFFVVVSIHHSCVSLNSDRACSTLIRHAASLLKDLICQSSHQHALDMSLYLDEQSIGFMLNTMLHALGRSNDSSGVRSNNGRSGQNENNTPLVVNAFFTRFVSDILFTLMYDQTTQPFISSTCQNILQNEANQSQDELLVLVINKRWCENGFGNHIYRQKFMKFVAQVSMVWSGRALPQTAVDLLN